MNKHEAFNKNTTIKFRISTAELNKIKESAIKLGKTVSAYCREKLAREDEEE